MAKVRAQLAGFVSQEHSVSGLAGQTVKLSLQLTRPLSGDPVAGILTRLERVPPEPVETPAFELTGQVARVDDSMVAIRVQEVPHPPPGEAVGLKPGCFGGDRTLSALDRLASRARQIEESTLPRYAVFHSNGRTVEVRRRGREGPVVVTIDGRDAHRLHLLPPNRIPPDAQVRWDPEGLRLTLQFAGPRDLFQRLSFVWDGQRMRLQDYDRCRLEAGATLERAGSVFDQGLSDFHRACDHASRLLSCSRGGGWSGLADHLPASWTPVQVQHFLEDQAALAREYQGVLDVARLDCERLTLEDPCQATFSIDGGLKILANPEYACFWAPCCATQEGVPDEPGVELIRTGLIRSSDVRTRHGERWLALTGRTRFWNLAWDTVFVGPGWDASFDRIGVMDGPEPLVLLRGPDLTPGPVVGAVEPGARVPRPGRPAVLRIGRNSWRLGLELDDDSGRLTLDHDGRRQTVWTFRERCPTVEWTGDLDRDGGLDLILQSQAPGESQWTLLLSSRSRHGELLRKVASWRARS
ncbi:MAG: hypothetical protein AB1758_01005 [Candidatus Eremiobacterota bacterium]